MTVNPNISFIIPVYNESETFPILLERMDALMKKIDCSCEVIIVDDGSTDSTANLMVELSLSNHQYQCVFLSRNFGHQRALSAGIEFSRGNYLMILDADLQDPPELFHEFYKKIKEGFEVVYGIRKNRKEGLLKVLAYNIFYKILNKISNYPIPKDTGDFCIISRRVANIIINMKEESRFLRGMRNWLGFKQIGIPYDRDERIAGKTKYSFRKLILLAHDGIFNFSTFPIKMLSFLGFSCIGVSLLYFMITVARKFIYNDVPTGFTALLFVILLFGGVQLLSLGIIGEYIQRIFFQVKNRPVYIVKNKIIDGKEYNE